MRLGLRESCDRPACFERYADHPQSRDGAADCRPSGPGWLDPLTARHLRAESSRFLPRRLVTLLQRAAGQLCQEDRDFSKSRDPNLWHLDRFTRTESSHEREAFAAV